ncbi:MAG: hypothetical protein JNN12_16485 [Bacteroidetes Order II. Incertae sedis bacterium]|nr:hypothetical protein [Bacteroidetes Order II. bacterium]
MLIIPTIVLQNGMCLFRTEYQVGANRTFFDDPVKMAKLWRLQNARTLLVFDYDAAYSDKNNFAFIETICRELDIPVMASGGVRTPDEVEALLSLQVHKVIVTARSPEQMQTLFRYFPSHRIGVHVNVTENQVVCGSESYDAVSYLKALEQARCYRVVCTVRNAQQQAVFAPSVFQALASEVRRMKLVISGGISDYAKLTIARSLDKRIDAVMINRALYENRFPCQAFWCWHAKESLDLDCFSTAKLRG